MPPKTTPTTIEWIRRTDEDIYEDGDILLVACKSRVIGGWVFEVVVIHCDEHFFEINTQYGESWDGDISDIDFYVPVRRIRLETLDA